MTWARAVPRGAAFVLMTAGLLPFYILGVVLSRPLQSATAHVWHLGCLRLCGLGLWTSGTALRGGRVLYVANHVSYLDIPVLGALIDATFVAKSDVAGWPLFGFLARMQRTVFVRRNPRFAAADAAHLRRRLERGESLIVFPEGTSSTGRQVLPFKSALFGALDGVRTGDSVWVQPVSVAYPRYADGRPLIGRLADRYAWYGGMTLFGHLMGVFGLDGALVDVTFHPPVKAAAFADRKALARHCEAAVADGVRQAHERRLYRRPDPQGVPADDAWF